MTSHDCYCQLPTEILNFEFTIKKIIVQDFFMKYYFVNATAFVILSASSTVFLIKHKMSKNLTKLLKSVEQ